LDFITENSIKKVGLQFLKTYYKYRPRKGGEPAVLSYDMRTSGGIIADGFYSFTKPDGSRFLATFEATSYYTKDEILFKRQSRILFWDGLAMASVVAAFAYSYGFMYQHFTINQTGIAANLAFLVLVFVFSFFLFHFIARRHHRYRYIYAVEQFKKYHADEQWVAIGKDVFEDPNDKYFRELKNQCVFNGFGLLRVDESGKPQVLITPSRQELFSGSRKIMDFFSQNRMQGSGKKSRYSGWWARIAAKFPGLSSRSGSLLRYRKSFFHQIVLTCISWALIGGVFFKQLSQKDILYVEKQDYEEQMAVLRQKSKQEQVEFLVDTAAFKPSFSKKKEPKWWDEKAGIPSPEKSPLPKPSDRSQAKGTKNTVGMLTGSQKETAFTYDCARFYNFSGTKFVVQDGLYENYGQASRRIDRLGENGFQASALWTGCFAGKEEGYVVYLNLIYNSEEEALENLSQNLKLADSKNLAFENLKIRTIRLKPQ